MKKSEFLNKTKEELQQCVKELLSYSEDISVDEANLLSMCYLLLSSDAILKKAADNEEGRESLLVLAEITKGLTKVLKMVSEENVTEYREEVLIQAKEEGEARGKERAAELEKDFENDMPDEDVSDEEIIKSAIEYISNEFGIDKTEIEATMQKSADHEKE